MVFTRFENGNLPNANEVINNDGFIMGNQIIFAASATTVPSLNNFEFVNFLAGGETKIDSSNSTCCYADISSSTRGGAWFCTQYDQFDDASISAVNWTTSASGTGSVVESGVKIRVEDSQTGAGSANNTFLQSDGSTGLDMRGQDGEIIMFLSYEGTFDNDNSATIKIGTTNIITLLANASPSTTFAEIRLVFNNSAQTVDGYLNGSKVASAINIAGEANWYARLNCFVDSSGGTDIAIIDLYTFGYVQDGDSNSVDFVTANATVVSSQMMVAAVLDDGGTNTINGSFDGGSGYTSIGDSLPTKFGSAGTTAKLKITQTVPSITSTITNIKKVTLLGYFYD